MRSATLICKYCGKEFYGKIRAEYCSDECRHQVQLEQKRRYREKKNRNHKRDLSLTNLAALARNEGLTYGQYVAKYGY